MTPTQYLFGTLSFTLLSMLGASQAASQSAPGKADAAAKAPAKKKAPVKAEPTVPAAGAEQIDAAQRVYYGAHECEFNLSLAVTASSKFPAYVDVTFGKTTYLMKPVLSTTGAMRLEHTKGETVLVQIAAKSMLLNVKTGRRMVDECIGATQREAVEVAKRAAAEVAAQQQAKAAAEAASAPVAASAPGAAAASNAASAPAAASAPEAPLPQYPAASSPSRPQ